MLTICPHWTRSETTGIICEYRNDKSLQMDPHEHRDNAVNMERDCDQESNLMRQDIGDIRLATKTLQDTQTLHLATIQELEQAETTRKQQDQINILSIAADNYTAPGQPFSPYEFQEAEEAKPSEYNNYRHKNQHRQKRDFNKPATLWDMAITTVQGLASYLTQRNAIADLQINQNSQGKQLESITLMTDGMSKSISKLDEDIPALRDKINNIHVESSLTASKLTNKLAFLNLKTALADNIIVLNAALQNANQGRVTNDLITPAEIQEIHDMVLKRDKLTIEKSYSAIIPHIIKVEGTWQIQFQFPIQDKYRQASLYQCHAVPTFLEQTSYLPIIDSSFVAFSMEENKYLHFSDMEAFKCMAKPSQCKTTKPFNRVTNGICGISPFFNMQEECSYQQSDNMQNFFLTLDNATFFSVANMTTMHTHCAHITQPGPEATTIISGKGIIITPPGCVLQTLGESILPHNHARNQDERQTNTIYAPTSNGQSYAEFTNNTLRRDITQFTVTFKQQVLDSLKLTMAALSPEREIMQTIAGLLGFIISFALMIEKVYRKYFCARRQRPTRPAYANLPENRKQPPLQHAWSDNHLYRKPSNVTLHTAKPFYHDCCPSPSPTNSTISSTGRNGYNSSDSSSPPPSTQFPTLPTSFLLPQSTKQQQTSNSSSTQDVNKPKDLETNVKQPRVSVKAIKTALEKQKAPLPKPPSPEIPRQIYHKVRSFLESKQQQVYDKDVEHAETYEASGLHQTLQHQDPPQIPARIKSANHPIAIFQKPTHHHARIQNPPLKKQETKTDKAPPPPKAKSAVALTTAI
jgi:hypothetical protein